MSKARLVITAVVEQHRRVAEVAAAYGVHRGWVYKLLARYRAEGEAAPFQEVSTLLCKCPVSDLKEIDCEHDRREARV